MKKSVQRILDERWAEKLGVKLDEPKAPIPELTAAEINLLTRSYQSTWRATYPVELLKSACGKQKGR